MVLLTAAAKLGCIVLMSLASAGGMLCVFLWGLGAAWHSRLSFVTIRREP